MALKVKQKGVWNLPHYFFRTEEPLQPIGKTRKGGWSGFSKVKKFSFVFKASKVEPELVLSQNCWNLFFSQLVNGRTWVLLDNIVENLYLCTWIKFSVLITDMLCACPSLEESGMSCIQILTFGFLFQSFIRKGNCCVILPSALYIFMQDFLLLTTWFTF